MNNNLLILGAGQYGALVYELASSLGCFDKIDFLDDQQSDKTIGLLSDIDKFSLEYSNAVVAIGNPDIRIEWLTRLRDCGYKVPVLVHPSAYVSPSAKLGYGCIVEPFAVVQTESVLGRGCIISSGAVVNHNACVEEGCHVDCNAVILARSHIVSGSRVSSLNSI